MPLAATDAPALRPLAGARLPDWCDAYLDPPGAGEFFATRLWYDATLAAALPDGAVPLLAAAGGALLPLLRRAGQVTALATPYTLDWRPLLRPGADPAAAGRALAPLFRWRPPLLLEALDPEGPALAPLLAGLRAGGLHAAGFDHVGHWHEALPPGTRWESYLAARPPALRTTIGRKLQRARRDLRWELLTSPGAALEAGIDAYVAVRAGSWKPAEPSPGFDPALMRAAAAAGLLRLGVLRQASDGAPVAAQYWVLDRGGSRAAVLKLNHLEAARAASPGTVLTALMIRHLLEVDGVRALDFGRGDDGYKRLWVGARLQRRGVVLADPWHPRGLAALAWQAAGAWRRAWAARG